MVKKIGNNMNNNTKISDKNLNYNEYRINLEIIGDIGVIAPELIIRYNLKEFYEFYNKESSQTEIRVSDTKEKGVYCFVEILNNNYLEKVKEVLKKIENKYPNEVEIEEEDTKFSVYKKIKDEVDSNKSIAKIDNNKSILPKEEERTSIAKINENEEKNIQQMGMPNGIERLLKRDDIE